jgi:hypothetical protein
LTNNSLHRSEEKKWKANEEGTAEVTEQTVEQTGTEEVAAQEE